MPLTLVTGRANSGKTGVLHAALRRALAAGLPVTLLLPTRPDVRRTEAELGAHGFVGVRLTVLDDWIGELWMLHGDGRRLVTPGARHVLLRRSLDGARLEALAPTAHTPGLLRLLADLVQRLTRPSAASAAGGTDRELADLVRAYTELAAAEGLVERGVAARLLAEDPPVLSGPVLVNRFTTLSEAQELLLTGVARTTEVAIALTWEPDLPATAALDPQIERMFASGEVMPRFVASEDTELGRLEERLYCPGDPIVPEGQLSVGLAAGDEAECVLAAQAARRLIDEGCAPERVAIVFRDAGRRIGLLAAALAAEDVAVDLDVAVPVASTTFGRAFDALMDAVASPSRERLLAFLLSPYADADADAVACLDSAWRRSRVSGERLLRQAAGLGPLTARALESATHAAAGLDEASAETWRAVADTLFAAAAAVRPLGSAESRLDAAVHRTILRAVDEVVAVRGARMSPADVAELLRGIDASLGGAERPGAVQVTEVHRVRSRRFDAVVLGGLTAEEFSAERPEPLAAEVAERLGAAPGMPERDAERMLFYLVATRARQRLVLLRQESDARGEAKRPSVFWDEVVDLYVGEAGGEEAAQWPPGIEPRRLGLAELASAAPAYGPGRRREREEAAGRGGGRPPHGVLAEDRVLEALAKTAEFAVTELETYLTCPYRWFYERAVKPRQLDVEVDARERGSRAHRILAAFYGVLEERLGLTRVVPERLDDVLALLEEVASESDGTARTRAVGLREELAVAQARQWARGIVRDDAGFMPGFQPVEHEFAFGEAAGRPFAMGGVALRGCVDRIDAGASGLVITDYKSDAKPPGHASFAGRGLVQLPVYAAAASALLGEAAAAGLYRSLRSLSIRGFHRGEIDLGGRGTSRDVLDADGVAALVAAAEGAVAEAAKGIRAGDIRPRPAGKDACGWCGARPFCEEARG